MVEREDIRVQLNELKRYTFYELLNLAGRAFLLVRYSDNVQVGLRGFLPEEKERGLVLVLNAKMNFTWDEDGVSAKLVFGNSVQKCFIPIDDIVAVYSPELNSQLVIGPQPASEANFQEEKDKNILSDHEEEGESDSKEETSRSKVVKVDFQKKRK